jgi:hypothetical protein
MFLKKWSERFKEMVKSIFRKIFAPPAEVELLNRKLAEWSERAEKLSASLDGEDIWFLQCEKKERKVVCESVKNETP